MSQYAAVIKKIRSIHWDTFKADYRSGKDPSFFRPTGTQVYVGRQGSGKTISAVKHALDYKATYPHAILVTNLALKPLSGLKPMRFKDAEQLEMLLTSPKSPFNPAKHYVLFDSVDSLHTVLVGVNNGMKGVIYLVDEIHTYFNSLQSKDIPMHVFTEISQQRKQRKCIVGTSQLFDRMAKPLREQCDNIIVCSTKFGKLTSQVAYDGMTLDKDRAGNMVGNIRKKGYFWQSQTLRESYDTYQKVISAQVQFDELSPYEKKPKKLGR